MRSLALWLAPAVLGVLAIAPEAAAQACGEREQIIKSLNQEFNEEPVAIGIDNRGRLIEVLAAERSGSWTILLTQPNGVSCLMATGTDWEQMWAAAGPAA